MYKVNGARQMMSMFKARGWMCSFYVLSYVFERFVFTGLQAWKQTDEPRACAVHFHFPSRGERFLVPFEVVSLAVVSTIQSHESLLSTQSTAEHNGCVHGR